MKIDHAPDPTAVRAAGERIARRVIGGSDRSHAYTRDLALEATLAFASATGNAQLQAAVAARRGWVKGFRVP